MTATYTYDGSPITTARRAEISFTQVADHGGVGSGRLTIDDTAGTQDIVGQKDFVATQDDCSMPTVFTGYVGQRTYSRKNERQGARREIDVELHDLNAMLGFRIIDGDDGNRPDETVDDRMAWLIASDYVSGLFIDNGRIASSSNAVDRTDYRYRFPGDVIADLATAAQGFNYHVQDYGSGPELIFRNDNLATPDPAGIAISNVHADIDSTTFYPFKDADLVRDPSQGRLQDRLRLPGRDDRSGAARHGDGVQWRTRRIGLQLRRQGRRAGHDRCRRPAPPARP